MFPVRTTPRSNTQRADLQKHTLCTEKRRSWHTALTAQWMQWLRHTRFDPPSLVEQQADQIRQERMKILAAVADERWASKPSVFDPPEKQQPIQMLTSRDPAGSVGQTAPIFSRGAPSNVSGQADIDNTIKGKQTGKDIKESPWKKTPRGGPSEDWQPEPWTPAPTQKRAWETIIPSGHSAVAKNCDTMHRKNSCS